MSLRVELLGGFAVTADGVVLDDLANQPVRAALLAFLAVRREAGREEIVGLLWPERGPTRARHALSQALHRLRQAVGRDAIVADGDRLRIAADVEIDVGEFEAHIAAGDLPAALALYRGHLMEEFAPGTPSPFRHWVDQERARLERAHRAARRERLAGFAEAGDTDGALAVAQEWVTRAPLDDEAQHTLIALLAEVSGRAAALRQYEIYARMLAAGDLTPLPETEALARQIRSGEAGAPPTPPVAGLSAAPAPEAPASPGGGAVRSMAIAAAALGLLLVALALRPDGRDAVAGTAPADRVVLADFAVASTDTSVADVVTEALRIDLERTLGPGLLCQREVEAALDRMRRPVGTRVDRDLALELAVREGAAFVVAGRVSEVGGRHILAARLIRAGDGSVVGSLREVAASEAEVIDGIERLSRGLLHLTGHRLGSHDGVQPLSRVTTASLPALRLYTEAVRISDTGADLPRAIALLEEAVAADSTFAMAHRKIAALLASSFTDRSRRIDALGQAYRFRDRLPQFERYLVVAGYHDQVVGDHDAAVAAYRAALELDPGSPTALNNLATLHVIARRAADADSLLAICQSLPVPIAHCHYNRVPLEFTLRGEPGARAALAEADRLFPASFMIALQRVWLESALGHYGRADSAIDRLAAGWIRSARAHAVLMLAAADLDAVRGRTREAEAHLDNALAEATAHELGDILYKAGLARALLVGVLMGDRGRAALMVDHVLTHPLVLRLDPLDYPFAEAAETYARLGYADRAAALLRRLGREAPVAGRSLSAPVASRARAIIALERGQLDEAAAALDAADRWAATSLPVRPLRARIHERSGDPSRALAEYRAYLDDRDIDRLGFDATLLGPVLQRVATLEAEAGRPDAASEARRRLRRLWARADPGIRARFATGDAPAEQLDSP